MFSSPSQRKVSLKQARRRRRSTCWLSGDPSSASGPMYGRHCARTQAGLAAGCSMLIHIHSAKKNKAANTICFGTQYCVAVPAMRWESRLADTRRGCQASSNLSMNVAAREPNISHFGLSARMIMLPEACARDQNPSPFKILQKCNLVPEIG